MAAFKITEEDKENILWLVRELEDFEKDKLLRTGLLDAAAVFKSVGRRLLKSRMKRPNGVTGNLLKSFRRRVKKRRLGVLAGFNLPEGSHAWLVDLGTTPRSTKTHDTGIMPALRYWSDAEKSGGRAIERISEAVRKKVQQLNERKG